MIHSYWETRSGCATWITYAAASHVFGIDGVDDQLIGKYMMSMPGGVVYFGALAVILRKRFGRSH